MAYETSTASGMGDLLSKLSTFAVANGWTEDHIDDGVTVSTEGIFALSKGDVYVSMKYAADSPNHMSLHQALGFINTSTDPGDHTDDSGNGYNGASPYADASLDDERCVNDLGDGPYPSYHFFEKDSSPAYIHVVVQQETDVYRHFGFGTLDKFNDWTGGEYCYGHYHATGTSGLTATGVSTGHSVLLDGLNAISSATARRCATIHAESLPGQGGSEKWLQVCGLTSMTNSANWTDSAGEDKQVCSGGFRAGIVAPHLGNFVVDPTTGFLPTYAIEPVYVDATNSFAYPLGQLPDVLGISMHNLTPGQEITLGADTYVVFPAGRRGTALLDWRTYYQGIAYKKVTA